MPTDGKRKFNFSSNEVVFTKPQVEKKIKANHEITSARPVTHVAVSPVVDGVFVSQKPNIKIKE
jgi:hypothetical protein